MKFENKGNWTQQIHERRLLKKGDRVKVHGQTGTIQQADWADPAMTQKIFKVLLDDTKKIEVFKDYEVKAESDNTRQQLMKFENKGKWLKEAQNKMAARDTMEDPDFLDGDDDVLTFEEEELDIEDNDIEEESAQKNEATFKNGTKVKVIKGHYSGKTGTIAGTAEEYDPDTYKTTNYCYMVKIPGQGIIQIDRDNVVAESAQKNEAKSERAYDINFDNMGGGFTVEKVSITNGYGIELSGYSSNTSKKLTYMHPTLSNDRGKSQDEIEKNYDALNAKRIAIAKDLKPLADKFDKDIEAVFAKHGFKKA